MRISPRKINVILVILIIMSMALSATAAYFGTQELTKASKRVERQFRKLKDSETNAEKLVSLEKQLAEIYYAPELLENLVTFKDKNIYQERAIETMRDYADIAGLQIARLSFVSSKVSKSKTTMQFEIDFQDPVDYNNLMRFILLTENSLLRMQITDLTISSKGEEGPVSAKGIKINVYIQQ